MQKSYFPSRDLIDLQTRQRRREEKTAFEAYGLPGEWAAIGASWAAVDKDRVRVTHSNLHTAEATAQEMEYAKVARAACAEQRRLWAETPPNVSNGLALPMGGYLLPEHAPVLPERGVGLGVHNPGVAHFASNTGTGNVSQRGRGDLHNGAPVSRREEKALELAMFEMKVKAQEERALKRAGKPGGRDAHKSALRMRRAYNLALSEFKSGGIMGRLHAFENGAARSGAGKAKSEAMKSEGAAPRARI